MNKLYKLKILLGLFLGLTNSNILKSQAQFEVLSSINTGNNALATNKIRSIQKDGNKLVFLQVGGVSFYESGNWSGMITGKINQNEIRDYVKTTSGKMYLPTVWGGIYEVNGPNYLNSSNFIIYDSYSGKVPTDAFLCAEADAQGKIWFGTEGKGIIIKDDTNFVQINTTNSGLLNDTIYDILFHGSKTFVATHRGLSVRDSIGNWTNMPNYSTGANGLWNPQCLDLFFDNNNNLWVGTYYGLSKWDGDTSFTTYLSSNGMADDWVKKITQDNAGNIWVANGSGISKFDGTTFTAYTSSGSISLIPYSDINCLEFDNNNNLWVGTEEHGVMKYNGNIWTVYNTSDGLPLSCFVFSVGTDSQGSIWTSALQSYYLSSEYAYGKITNGVYSSLTPKTPAGEKIGLKGYSQLLDDNNRHWITTVDKGAAIETNGVWQIFSTSNSSLPSNTCRSVSKGFNGDVWVATTNGLVKFNNQLAMSVYTTTNGLPNNNIYDIQRDYSGNIWVATVNGLSKYNGTSWTNYDTTTFGGGNNTVYRLAVDADSNLWLSFYGQGLVKYDGNTWSHFDMNNSTLPSNYYYDLIIDHNGNLLRFHQIMELQKE